MALDAIIIADSGNDSFSGTTPLKFALDNQTADIQVVLNYLENNGSLQPPIAGADRMSWASAPRLNGIYLASYLSQHNFEVALINSYYEQREDFIALLHESPRVVFISTTFFVNKRTLAMIAADIRSLAPDIIIAAGGAFVNLSYALYERSRTRGRNFDLEKRDFLFLETTEPSAVDFFIISPRGETIARKALRQIKERGAWDDLPNIAVLKEDEYHFTPMREDISKPLTPIQWALLPDSVFQSGVVPMQASNGCTFNCSFCNFVKDRRLQWVKPIDDIVRELLQVKKRGVNYVWFVDDNFRLGRGDLEEACRELIKANLGLGWMTMMRASALENLDVSLLHRAGCIEVQLGIESADSQMLKRMNKKATPELYEKVLHKLLVAGINCSCYLIFGFPGETEQSIDSTIAFIRKIERDIMEAKYDATVNWSIYPFLMAPLSPIYESEMREKYKLTGFMENWEHATMRSSEVKKYILKAFHSMEITGSIYRGDNLDFLRALTPERRKHFRMVRHKLAKTAIDGSLEKCDILQELKTTF